MRVETIPEPEQLRVASLGPPRFASPLTAPGTIFADDNCRILIAGDTHELDNNPGSERVGFEPAGPRPSVYFDGADTRCGIVTCGGLCPGINDVIRAIVLTLWHHYGVHDILGFSYGYAGLVPANGYLPQPLVPETVRHIHETGGTVLGSSRGPQPVQEMVETLVQRRIDILFAIGGDGTLTGASLLAAEIGRRGLPIAIIGVPKTIDNDLMWIERSFGFATAVNEATRSIVAAHTEARGAWNGIGLVKLMGRLSGFIAAHATLANSQVNFCLVPEVPFELDGDNGLQRALARRLQARHHAVILVAEGAGQALLQQGRPQHDASGNTKLGDIGPFLRDRLLRHLEQEGIPSTAKYIDPSYLIRSLPANSFDSALCLALGQHAVHAGMAGRTDMLVGSWNGRFTHVPLRLATARRRRLDPRGTVWQRVLAATGQPALMSSGSGTPQRNRANR